MEHTTLITILGIGLNGENNRKSALGKLTEETLAAGIGSEVGSIENLVVKIISVTTDILHPFHVTASLILADGLAVSIQVPPAHKFLDILNQNVMWVDSLDITEQMFSQCPAVSVPRLTALCLGEVRTFQTGPQYHVSIRVFLLYLLKMGHKRTQFKCSDILGEM